MKENPSTTRPRFHYAWVILIVGTLVVFGSLGLARFGYSTVLEPMRKALDLTRTDAGILGTANLAGYLALAVVGGALASRFGPRIVIGVGLALAAVSMLLTGLAGGLYSAMGWRALTGVGSGASNVPVMALLAAWFAKRRRGLAAGIGVAGSSLALIVLGPLVPGVLTAAGDDGWRVCWLLFAGATALLAVLALVFLRNRPAEVGLRALGATGEEEPARPRTSGLAWRSVYRSWTVWHVGLIYVAFGFSYIIYLTFFFGYLETEGGYDRASAGWLFMVMGWVSLLCGLIWGWVSDVIGRKWALVIVYVIQAASFALFALWRTPFGFTSSAVLFGLTAWSIPAIVAALSGDLLGPRLAPAGLGFVTLFFGLGQAAGPTVAGAIGDATGSLSWAMLLAAGVALLGAVGSLLLRRTGAAKEGSQRH